MEDATAARDKDCHDDLDPVQHDFISTGKSSSKQPYIFFFCSIPKHQEEIMARADLLVLLHALTNETHVLRFESSVVNGKKPNNDLKVGKEEERNRKYKYLFGLLVNHFLILAIVTAVALSSNEMSHINFRLLFGCIPKKCNVAQQFRRQVAVNEKHTLKSQHSTQGNQFEFETRAHPAVCVCE
ncbi:hypothetical protein OUZ56_007780 [Daphnia magna]|uniref:Uncharacterized protein n=1 Tax=Daphnia magna TaxID=35525 RepID=A0ABR0AAZ5_9CRUS|nr:hypothetical protein OUZ56_007780 [Daphnia magna]